MSKPNRPGRPPLIDNATRADFRLPLADVQRAERIAKYREITRSEVLREAVAIGLRWIADRLGR